MVLGVRMGQISPCVLGLFLLITLLYSGHAEDAVLTLEPNWSTFFTGESVTLICDTQEREETDWEYQIKKDSWEFVQYNSYKRYTLHLWTGYSSEYQCFARHRRTYEIKRSNIMSLTVSDKPKATLLPGTTTIPAGGSVTLTCSVDGSAEWKYYWSRQTSGSYEDLTMRYGDQNRELNISQGGKYWCTGGRGNPVFYTHASDVVPIKITFSNKVTLTLQPSWRQIFSGETITLRCEIEGGGDVQWEYEWRTPVSSTRWTYVNYWSISASPSYSGSYTCRGAHRGDQDSSTEWSKGITITVSHKPRPVLTVSPSWLSPGASVTLKCEVELPSAGWRFYWYKAVPDGSQRSYSYELLPGNSSGTEQDSYIVHGQTHTAGYVCKAGRGDPVIYTETSELKFVWSGDVRPSASLTVSPDRVQHFTSDSVSLSCEGNSTEWRVMRFAEGDYLSCSDWGRMTGSICNIHSLQYADAVYWCESGSGEFSNAVNMTADTGIILVSPVHPVAEGASVTLSCKLRPENVLSNVIFYKNDKLIQNDTRRELTIPAVSRSHEGFYKCKGETSLRTLRSGASLESWMSVKSVSGPEDSWFPVPLIVGLVCGLLLIVLLLLLFRYRKTKNSCFIRSQSTNQSSATDHMMKQDETQCRKYTSPLHDESRDVTYSVIELENVAKNNDKLMYAQLVFHKKGRSAPAAADKTVYSEIKVGPTHDQ
ncbi:uncharacterized protein LOC130164142 isoform X1 [Seriola aureovittata]|uniref:uncharacterized protein LOC130164142 isoform X1 n=1 Tax=Seriola aureovittata TaxID=2871759 RepID=UPI0024BEBE51|nr:uncharacterized protein LOC130164142 isoform X1 [Seriola aureovittata]